MTSARLPADILAALRKLADENDETLSDLLRRGALMVLGICPTCGQRAPQKTDAPAAGETGDEAATAAGTENGNDA